MSKEIIQRQPSNPRLHKLITENFLHNKILGPSRQACYTLSLGNLTYPLRIDPSMALWPKWCSAKSATGRTLTQEEHQVSTRQVMYSTGFCLIFWGVLCFKTKLIHFSITSRYNTTRFVSAAIEDHIFHDLCFRSKVVTLFFFFPSEQFRCFRPGDVPLNLFYATSL